MSDGTKQTIISHLRYKRTSQVRAKKSMW